MKTIAIIILLAVSIAGEEQAAGLKPLRDVEIPDEWVGAPIVWQGTHSLRLSGVITGEIIAQAVFGEEWQKYIFFTDPIGIPILNEPIILDNYTRYQMLKYFSIKWGRRIKWNNEMKIIIIERE